jgi:hypothetical protein
MILFLLVLFFSLASTPAVFGARATILPNANATGPSGTDDTNWTGAGSTRLPHWQLFDEGPTTDALSILGNTTNQREFLGFQNASDVGINVTFTINYIEVWAASCKASTANDGLTQKIRYNRVDYNATVIGGGGAVEIATCPTYTATIINNSLNPATSSSWSITDLNILEEGMDTVADVSPISNLTSMWLIVNYNIIPLLKVNASADSSNVTIQASKSTLIKGNCNSINGTQMYNIVLQNSTDNASYTNITATNTEILYANVSDYNTGQIIGNSTQYLFNVTPNSPGTYYLRMQCNATAMSIPTAANSTQSPNSPATSVILNVLAVPSFADTQINKSTVYINDNVSHTTNVTTLRGTLANYTFEWNATGADCGTTSGFVNQTFTAPSVNNTIVNVTKIIPAACAGRIVGWRIYVNNTQGVMNNTGLQSYQVYRHGFLNVSIIAPEAQTTNLTQNQTFNITARVLCSGGEGAYCGTVQGLARYNASGTEPDMSINTTFDVNYPFYAMGSGTGVNVSNISYWRPYNWSVATIGIGKASNPENATDRDYNDSVSSTLFSSTGVSSAVVNYTFQLSTTSLTRILYFRWNVTNSNEGASAQIFNFSLGDFVWMAQRSGIGQEEDKIYSYNVTDELINSTGHTILRFYVSTDIGCGPCGAVFNLSDIHITMPGTTYDYKGITNPSTSHAAEKNNSPSNSFPTGLLIGNEFATADYQAINLSDNSKFSLSQTGVENNKAFVQFNFTITEPVSSITNFEVWAEATQDCSNQNVRLWLWNSAAWVNIANTTSSTTDQIVRAPINSSITNYFDLNNRVYALIDTPENCGIPPGANNLYVDYTRLNVLSEGGGTVQAQNPQSCGTMDFTSGTCELNWTVNATGNPGTIWNIDVNFNSTSPGVADNNTANKEINITVPVVGPNTCTPVEGAQWDLLCSDNCVISGLNRNVTNWIINGSGTITFTNTNLSYQNFTWNPPTSGTCSLIKGSGSAFTRRSGNP